jgi:HD-GYP domain-containing protein (c-di-GMP phosphodiesterase class II)
MSKKPFPRLADLIKSDSSQLILGGYRQRLLNILLIVSFFILLVISCINIFEWLRDPGATYSLFLDLLALIILVSAWRLNQKDHGQAAGWVFTLLMFLAIPSIYPAPYWGRSLLVMAMSVAVSSFIIQPRASFLFAGLAVALYSIDVFSFPGTFEFDSFSLFSLCLLAIGAFLVSKILNLTIHELILAYDETISSLATALEMRDSETLGHSKRVVELTILLAKKLGIKDDELVHVRRGVLLHDFGKMSIPDAILHKPEPLSGPEWEIMRRHPEYARDSLMKVSYLAPALDIPYCHHEKWDGSGYPRGLKGEQIPFPARIFAVVDVWDALTSDRPYRPALSRAQALQYIREQAGKHFDPRIVAAFTELIAAHVLEAIDIGFPSEISSRV